MEKEIILYEKGRGEVAINRILILALKNEAKFWVWGKKHTVDKSTPLVMRSFGNRSFDFCFL